jgi:hypothetical protein
MSVTCGYARKKFGKRAVSVATMALSLLLLTSTGIGHAGPDEMKEHKKECKDKGYSIMVIKDGVKAYEWDSNKLVASFDLPKYTCIGGSVPGSKINSSNGDETLYYLIDKYINSKGEPIYFPPNYHHYYKHGEAAPA